MLVNIIIFIFGSVLGSFLNVCIYRLPLNKSIAWPGSYCPHCKEPIKLYDNIPIISFILLGGRCRKCKVSIPIRYPIVELSTGLLFVLNYTLLGFGFWDLGFYFNCLFLSYLVLSFFMDLETQLLADIPSYGIITAGLLYNFLNGAVISSFRGALLGFGIIYLIGFFGKLYYKKEVMGTGDMLLAAAFGAFLGWQSLLVALMLGYMIGAAVSLFLIAIKKKTMQDYIPFGPSLVIGALTALFFGQLIINYYIANLL